MQRYWSMNFLTYWFQKSHHQEATSQRNNQNSAVIQVTDPLHENNRVTRAEYQTS